MIFLIIHIICAIIGIKALCTGKIALSRKSEITGPPARLIGFLSLMTYPVAGIFGFCYAGNWIPSNPGKPLPLMASLYVNFGAFIFCAIAIAIVAFQAPKNKPDKAEE